ncbi:VOC family protein [Streptomyces albogriseolus]|uniref:VOC family protein n=1 Tax=Streptomyces albogriseolus TaxID=1887 RepID=UPI0036E5973A
MPRSRRSRTSGRTYGRSSRGCWGRGRRSDGRSQGGGTGHHLADFYESLLGWPRRSDAPEWVELAPSDGGTGLSFQTEPLFSPPRWPSGASEQQMMTHLDIEVDDLTSAVERAVALGATEADYQPQDDVRVLFDPVGHPFCLFVRTDGGT